MSEYFSTYNSNIPTNNVQNITTDKAGNIYVATMCGGAGVYNENGILLNTENNFTINKNIEIYPNPASDFITVQTDDFISAIEIWDLQGKLIKNLASAQKHVKIDIRDLINGCYIIRFQTFNDIIVTKFIKN